MSVTDLNVMFATAFTPETEFLSRIQNVYLASFWLPNSVGLCSSRKVLRILPLNFNRASLLGELHCIDSQGRVLQQGFPQAAKQFSLFAH